MIYRYAVSICFVELVFWYCIFIEFFFCADHFILARFTHSNTIHTLHMYKQYFNAQPIDKSHKPTRHPVGAICGSLSCPRTLYHVPISGDWTANLQIKGLLALPPELQSPCHCSAAVSHSEVSEAQCSRSLSWKMQLFTCCNSLVRFCVFVLLSLICCFQATDWLIRQSVLRRRVKFLFSKYHWSTDESGFVLATGIFSLSHRRSSVIW